MNLPQSQVEHGRMNNHDSTVNSTTTQLNWWNAETHPVDNVLRTEIGNKTDQHWVGCKVTEVCDVDIGIHAFPKVNEMYVVCNEQPQP